MRRRRALALLALPALVGVAVGGRVVVRALRSGWGEYRVFAPRRYRVPMPADAAALGFRPVHLDVAGAGAVHGWYAPARNRAAVVLAHGSSGDRRDVYDVARAVARAGYGALLFDFPGGGESEGPVDFGARARRTLAAAVTYVSARPEVDPGRVGAYGFSMGAYTLAQVAAEDARVRAVVLAAPPADAEELTRGEYAHGGPLAQWMAVAGARLGGFRFDEPQPRQVVGRIAPRPLLVLTGARDGLVPPAMAHEVYAAAGAPKQLWIVEGAVHGRYELVAADYGDRVRAFFDGALRDR